jgi:hypothetical protein
VFLLSFCGIYNRNRSEEFLGETTAQEMSVMEVVGVDDPPGNIAMLDEGLSSIRGLNPFLNMRTLASWATSGE